MKTIVLTSLLVLSQTLLFSQQVMLSVQTEYTVAGAQYGASSMYETKKLLGGGVFYQTDVKAPAEGLAKNTYYGVQVQVPLAKAERLNFFGTLRGGLVNEKFVVVVPGLETRINAGKHFAVSFGMSLRMNYPAVSSKLTWKF
jgi:hypothetical protein